MPTYTVDIYEFDALSVFSNTPGGTITYSGPSTANGSAAITDNQTGVDGQNFDDAASENATATTTIGGNTTTGNEVYADEAWTLIDTVTGKEFQLVTFRVNDGTNQGWYTLSEIPLVPGRIYETVSFDNTPDASAGEASFSYADYAAASDGIVSGTDGDDVIDANYTGDTSNDVVDGLDAPSPTPPTPLQFNWTDYTDEQDLRGGVSQNTNGIQVEVTYSDLQTNEEFSAELSGGASDAVYVAPGEPFSTTSAGYIFANGSADDTTVAFDFSAVAGSGFSDSVQNVQFRISDIDGLSDGANNFQDIVTVNAFDAAGNAVFVNITGGSNHTVTGNTITGALTNFTPGSVEASALIEIAGPVASIQIIYDNGGDTQQAIYLTDIHFDAVPVSNNDDVIEAGAGNDTVFAGEGEDTVRGDIGNDIIDGGTGDDLLQGEAGQDTLFGGEGEDRLEGGSGADILDGGAGNDTLLGGGGSDQITLGQSDTATGGGGDDTFLIDGGQLDGGTIDIVGGETGEGAGDTLDFNGQLVLGSIIYTDPTTAAGRESGTATLLDGTTVTFSEIENIICFGRGTLIDTPHGARRVEELQVGDLVLTRDAGPQPIRWAGNRHVATTEATAPVVFAPGAFGNDDTLLVSPQHRMVLEGYLAELHFGEREVLVAAQSLINGTDIVRRPPGLMTYHHIMFDDHQIVTANGAASESYQPGSYSLSGLEDQARAELLSVFPELRANPVAYGQSARVSVKNHVASLLSA
ncbi:Ca2+-binding RTX toxin-like protein [Litoreibacter ponti]|uniref:Ca2+-binding RTX toxin-like protein n=1 Tax=Litoreibacter ponti TaxID=1510457 RepID=A0A2T6BDH0_9RHOB|nr:Hint domain-containing protein [Litoreibacter ponti]PTX54103.1 Ca2+-binding RTX toxin-like protein [Litoreibacter ponti]